MERHKVNSTREGQKRWGFLTPCPYRSSISSLRGTNFMTQPRKESARRKGVRQTELPLSSRQSPEKIQRSKLIFQLKTELHRLIQRDREWKLMFSMLSHDLKEPLLTLEGFTKLLQSDDKDQKRYI